MRALAVYHKLPHPLRAAAVTAQGYRLAHWRYGPETEDLVALALERERWEPARLQDWQARQLERVLHRASTAVPYYRHLWSRRGGAGGNRSPHNLADWPILERSELKAHSEAFVAEDKDVRRMKLEKTGGTTGPPATLYFSRETHRAWYALAEARWRGWNGLCREDAWANVAGVRVVVPLGRGRPPYWVWNPSLRQLYMSTYHLTFSNTLHYLSALRRYAIQYAWGYPSALNTLACGVLAEGLDAPQLEVVLSSAEAVHPHQRRNIEKAFSTTFRETYGMSEMVTAASECEAGRLHLWSDLGVVEVVGQDGHPIPEGEVGELVATSLINLDSPLIRYRTGDRGAVLWTSRCPCGRSLPILTVLEGRVKDLFFAPDGRLINSFAPVMQVYGEWDEYQLVQESVGHVRFVYVPSSDFDQASLLSVAKGIKEVMGDVRVSFEETDRIPRLANGKFKLLDNRLSDQERDEWLRRRK